MTWPYSLFPDDEQLPYRYMRRKYSQDDDESREEENYDCWPDDDER